MSVSVSLIAFSNFIPYGMPGGLVMVLLTGFIAFKRGVKYDALVKRKKVSRILGYVFVIVGLLLLGYPIGNELWARVWPVLFITIGAMLVSQSLSGRKREKL